MVGKTIWGVGKCTLKKSAESERHSVHFADCTSVSLDPHILISGEHVFSYVHGSGSGCGADSLTHGMRETFPEPPALGVVPPQGPFAPNHLAGVSSCFCSRLMCEGPLHLETFHLDREVQRVGHIPQPKWKAHSWSRISRYMWIFSQSSQSSGLIVGVGLKIRCCESWKLL